MNQNWFIVVLFFVVISADDLDDCYKECGNNPALFSLAPRSFGGSVAKQAPFIGLLEVRHVGSQCTIASTCTASIISSSWILSALHCLAVNATALKACGVSEQDYLTRRQAHTEIQLAFQRNMKFYPGITNKLLKEESQTIEIDYYETTLPKRIYEFVFDLALLKLKTPLKFSKNVQKICLLKNSVFPAGKTLFSMGYGKVSNETLEIPGIGDEIVEGKTPMKIETQLMAVATCKNLVQFNPNMICSGSKNTGLLPGDSGGPLFSENENKFYLIGVASEKLTVPADALSEVDLSGDKYPDIYTNISKKCTWIAQITGSEAVCNERSEPMSDKCRNVFVQLQNNAVENNIFESESLMMAEGVVKTEYPSICQLLNSTTCEETFSCRLMCYNEQGKCVAPALLSEKTRALYGQILYNSFGAASHLPTFYGKNGQSCGDGRKCVDYECKKDVKPQKLENV